MSYLLPLLHNVILISTSCLLLLLHPSLTFSLRLINLNKNLLGEGLLGGFSQVGRPPPILPSRKTNIYIYTIVPACVLIPLANHNPAIFLSPKVLKLNKLPKAGKSPVNSNLFLMFSNNTYIDLRTASKHVLIPSYFIQVT